MSLSFNQRITRPLLRLLVLASVVFLFPDLLDAQGLASATAVPGAEPIPGGLPPDIKFMIATLGGGGVAGWAVGYTLKKVAKMLALIIGVAFISLQVLAFKNYIYIDWARIKSAVPGESLEDSASGLMSILTYNLPFAGSFIVGFWLGFRKG
ncbi:MAG TPA: FUN14 domain-containing protein [Candidatus Rifleibacterium sp.]|nr:FUN14 domain-containing protein [Candidatus Rifleibacterium sp.]HPT44700.1 FUN14 domain-containing protein [Candidatus Rifleibacterium sp.]